MRVCLAVALSLLASAASPDTARLTRLSHLVLEDLPGEFGGLSAIEVSRDGTSAHVLSDTARLFEIRLNRAASGTLTEVYVLSARYLHIPDPDERLDSEGLAFSPDGITHVSVESPPQVLHFAPGQHWPTVTDTFPELEDFAHNRGFEALAIDPENRLVTLTEIAPDGAADIPIYRRENGTWTAISQLPDMTGYMVVGADFGPDGRLYVLERAVSLLGFRSRIRRAQLETGPLNPETLLESDLSQYDNLEGISVWQDAQGRTVLTLVSDGNYLSVQRNEIVEFLLKE